ncbi:DUF1588 domain-containing protein [Rubripirellula sp.]|nr:DUF1588 domain-containing protein [Rubripirellula sp.]
MKSQSSHRILILIPVTWMLVNRRRVIYWSDTPRQPLGFYRINWLVECVCVLTLLGILMDSQVIAQVPAAVPGVSIPVEVRTAINEHCSDCHRGEAAEAGIRLDDYARLQPDGQLALLNRIQDQVFFGLMPPADSEPLPESARSTIANWLRDELRRRKASNLDEKLRLPAYGNYVDHKTLFDGSIVAKPFTPSRRWLVSPQIFHERVNAVFKLQGRSRQKKFYGVTNPIVLPDHSGIRYFDTTAVDGGHLLVMLNNADWISEKQIIGAIQLGEKSRTIVFANQKDRWYPSTAPESFVTILNSDTVPTDDLLIAAIHAQYDCVLQRKATQTEIDLHLPGMRANMELAGNREGLRQMLVSVLLKSEFLYRLEFGTGPRDEHGRQRLSPREASYAIAYALSDRPPDALLTSAAREGRLITSTDYRREVNRLLDDKQSFYGAVDPNVSSGHIRPHEVTHPKLVRFFREFFGYPNSIKLFKDVARSGGFYDNAGRDYTGTAGSVTNEADRVVDHILKRDANVFETLLTTDEFFVLHPRSNEDGQALVESWRRAYEGLKDTDWENNTEQTLLENFDQHQELFAALRITDLKEERRRVHLREFKRYMKFFDHTFAKGKTPITFPWFFHGGQKFRHSEIYNLPPVPGAGPLDYRGQWTRGGYEAENTWDYPVVQPFKVPHRKGILTHPAWLLAHSQNTETDPVRRGRWIREKLLAGLVPEVPITVDAVIPEDHHRTLRERLNSVTTKQECWKCHQRMNPLGLPFESFDDFGRFRTEESLEHPENLLKEPTKLRKLNVYKTRPVDSQGYLSGTDDPRLDGEIEDAFDLIDRLAKSDRVRQSIIRHAFRFFLGRNEMLSDSQTLINADQAYLDNGGSFRAVVVSLLSSDSFIYRKTLDE